MKFKLMLTLAGALAGCSILPGGAASPGIRYFTLEKFHCDAEDASELISVQVPTPSAAPGIDTEKILYAKNSIERAYYQYSFWLSSPVNQFSMLLRSALSCAGFSEDSTQTKRPGYVLETKIEEFFHDASVKPGVARIRLSARLLQSASSEMMATHTFSSDLPVSEYSAEGAVRALSAGSSEVAKEVIEWVRREIVKK